MVVGQKVMRGSDGQEYTVLEVEEQRRSPGRLDLAGNRFFALSDGRKIRPKGDHFVIVGTDIILTAAD